MPSVIILLSMFDQGCRFARGTGAGGKSRVSKSIGFQTVEETTQSYSNMYEKNNLNKMRFSILIALKIRLQMGMVSGNIRDSEIHIHKKPPVGNIFWALT